jgi:hypothetical protein
MKVSFYPPRREKRSLSVLVLGGKYEFDQLALRYEESRLDRHVLLLATCMKAAWEILSTNQVDRIVIEAFMENAENESPFQFLNLLKHSAYSHIPVLLVAIEPSALGRSLAPVVAQAAHCFGAEFQLVQNSSQK